MSERGNARKLPKIKSDEWNVNIENVAKEIGESAKMYKFMHLHVAQEADRRHSYLMLLGICTGPIAGMLSTLQTSFSSYEVFSSLSTIFSFLSGILVAIIKFAKYDSLLHSHKTAAARYTSLESNVRRQLALYRNNRINSSDYLDWLTASYDDLVESSPLIPQKVTDKVIKNYGSEIVASSTKDREINREINMDTIIDNTEIVVQQSPEKDNKTESPKPVCRTDQKKEHIRKISRNSSTHIPEFSRYDDNMMNYELKRFANLYE